MLASFRLGAALGGIAGGGGTAPACCALRLLTAAAAAVPRRAYRPTLEDRSFLGLGSEAESGGEEERGGAKMNKPNRIILTRHGESVGNVNDHLYAMIPDNRIPLSPLGVTQANKAGSELKKILGEESVRFFVSPYRRTQETYREIVKSFNKDQYSYREEPRLREQDFGNFQNVAALRRYRAERKEFGSFYYRFAQGESGADVYDRVSTFIETMHRDFRRTTAQNYVLVSHGLTCRLFLMRYYHWTVDKFHRVDNLENCQIVIMQRDGSGKYVLMTPLREHAVDGGYDSDQ